MSVTTSLDDCGEFCISSHNEVTAGEPGPMAQVRSRATNFETKTTLPARHQTKPCVITVGFSFGACFSAAYSATERQITPLPRAEPVSLSVARGVHQILDDQRLPEILRENIVKHATRRYSPPGLFIPHVRLAKPDVPIRRAGRDAGRFLGWLNRLARSRCNATSKREAALDPYPGDTRCSLDPDGNRELERLQHAGLDPACLPLPDLGPCEAPALHVTVIRLLVVK